MNTIKSVKQSIVDQHFYESIAKKKILKVSKMGNSKSQRYYPSNKQMTCKVQGCKIKHLHHFCHNCKNSDSKHRTRDCPSITGTRKNCRCPECSENHAEHYCKVCETNDVDHLARNCPDGELYYHGTSENCAQGIMLTKMNASKVGNLGAGIYFTSVKNAAIGISRLRSQQYAGSGRPVLIIANIKKKPGYFKERIHEPWTGAYEHDFPEIAVTDDSYLRIKSYEFV